MSISMNSIPVKERVNGDWIYETFVVGDTIYFFELKGSKNELYKLIMDITDKVAAQYIEREMAYDELKDLFTNQTIDCSKKIYFPKELPEGLVLNGFPSKEVHGNFYTYAMFFYLGRERITLSFNLMDSESTQMKIYQFKTDDEFALVTSNGVEVFIQTLNNNKSRAFFVIDDVLYEFVNFDVDVMTLVIDSVTEQMSYN